jgi:4-amino-4-deoxy-L-arabinose transferase-like glycosyltransferase
VAEPESGPAGLAKPIFWYTALAGAFVATAAVSAFFIDRPFNYSGPSEWVANLTRSTQRFPGPEESGLIFAAIVFLLPAILILAHALSAREAWDPRRAFPPNDPRLARRALACVALAVLLGAACRLFVTRGVPLLDDERSYLFQARLLASGKISLPSAPEGLRNPMFLLAPRWLSKYPPGQALVLLPGVLLGTPWMMPLVVGGLLSWGVFVLMRNIHGPRPALLAAALMAACPCAVVVSATLLSFAAVACQSVWCLASLAEAERTGRARWHVLSGACLGLAVLTRPLDALVLGLVVALGFARAIEQRETERPVAALARFAAGFLPVAAVLPFWNWRVSGAPWRLGYTEAHDYGFGFFVRPIDGYDYVHTPLQSIGNLMVGLLRMDLWLLAWPTSLLLVLVGLRSAVVNRHDRMLRSILPIQLVAISLLASTGVPELGAAYLIPIAPFLVMLAVRGLQAMARSSQLNPRLVRFVLWACVVGAGTGWAFVMPLRLARLRALTTELEVPWRTVAEAGIGDAIVIVPAGAAMGAVGRGLGYPYEIATGPSTRARLCRLFHDDELPAVRAFLGKDLPVYRLRLDRDTFARQGARRYRLERDAAP